jgi:large subunit ribosomal protein L25
MERITIRAEKREETGKGKARSLRRKEMIPAILYRGGGSLPIKLPKKEITHFINTTAGEQAMVNLQFQDGENKLALMKEYQIDPTKRELLHADFFEVSLTEKVKVNVHVSTTGEPVGVKRDGGILQNVLREIEVECLPDKIPSHIRVDISALEIGQSLHVSDLKLEEEVRILTDSEGVIANVIAPVVEEVAPAAEEVAAPEEAAEPEVIKKGKKEEEEEEVKEKEKEKEKEKK